MNKLKASSAAAALMVMVAQPALAGTSTTTFTVSASVVAACASVSATNISFGNILPGGNANATGTISVTCASGTPYSVDLDNGLLPNSGARGMALDANNALQYQIFKDAAHTAVWGSGLIINAGSVVSGVGTGATQSITAYAITWGYNILAGMAPAIVGNYSDTITVTLSF